MFVRRIKQYAAEYKKPLRKQIKAIDPDIIFLCGTESAFDKLIDNGEWKKEDGDFKNLSCLNCNKTDSQWFYFFTFKEEKKDSIGNQLLSSKFYTKTRLDRRISLAKYIKEC